MIRRREWLRHASFRSRVCVPSLSATAPNIRGSVQRKKTSGGPGALQSSPAGSKARMRIGRSILCHAGGDERDRPMVRTTLARRACPECARNAWGCVTAGRPAIKAERAWYSTPRRRLTISRPISRTLSSHMNVKRRSPRLLKPPLCEGDQAPTGVDDRLRDCRPSGLCIASSSA